jgi:hypothetical protein
LLLAACLLRASAPGGIDEKSAQAIVIGLLLIAFVMLNVLALALGIAGLLQSDRKRLLAALGTTFSSVTLSLTVFVMVPGATSP